MSVNVIAVTETVMTIIFAIEIVVRFAISFPDWRVFFRSKSNCFDLFLVAATCVIQIPPIHDSGVYGWLTIFQILRVYRIIMAVPVTRDLLVRHWHPRLTSDQSPEQRVRYIELDLLLVHDHVLLCDFGLSVDAGGHPNLRSQ